MKLYGKQYSYAAYNITPGEIKALRFKDKLAAGFEVTDGAEGA